MNDYVYILGYGRSGSTLLESLIAQRYNYRALGEVKYYYERGVYKQELCSCGNNISACAYWSKISKNVEDVKDPGEVGELTAKFESSIFAMYNIVLGKYRRGFKKYIDATVKLYQALLDSGAFVDSSKMPMHLYWLNKNIDVRPKIIYMVRDPRAVSWSCGRNVVRKESAAKLGPDGFMPKFNYFSALFKWSLNAFVSALVVKLSKSEVYYLKYEDFVKSPDKYMNELDHFLGKDKANTVSDNLHSISGNPRRFTNGLDSIKYDDEWERKLGKGKMVAGYLLTLPFSKVHGYKMSGDMKHATKG